MSEQVSVVYRFGPFRLEPASGLLLRDDQPVPLTPKAFDALLHLVERSGRLVTKDDLMQALWTDAIVGESNLTQTIFILRKALADDGSGPRYITTVPWRGYRFDAEVRRSSPDDGETGAVEPPPAHGDSSATAKQPVKPLQVPASSDGQPRRIRSVQAGLLTVAIVLTLGIGGYLVWRRPQHRLPSPPSERIMLAVLPFENLTGDPSQEYLSDGLTEEIIAQLGNLTSQHLGVIARTSVMHYKNSQIPLDQIARELGVEYVIEGSVRREPGNVRITAQLIHTKDQSHVWARQYDREPKTLLGLQGEIAQEVADEIQLTLGDHKSAITEPKSGPQDFEAYDLYLKGLYHFNKRTIRDFEEAIRYFQEATAKDPNYARAYTGLADSYALMPGYAALPQGEFMARAREAALKALAIDPNLAEAHCALALIVQNYDWDWRTAEKEFRRALELDPNYVAAHHWYAEHLMWRGRFDEALQESERARQLDPLSLIIATDNGAILYFSRQYDRAIEKWRSVLEMDPKFPRAALIRLAYVEKGMFAEALADGEAHGFAVGDPWYWSYRAIIYGRSGDTVQAQRALRELLQLNRRQAIDPIVMADTYAGLGDKEQTLAWLEKGYAQHSSELVSLKVNPAYDLLRGDRQFEDLLRRVGLGE